tara:strand:- start:799 stop:1011 length:213 start_codon:yes stop_codon:yes gene_type:complete
MIRCESTNVQVSDPVRLEVVLNLTPMARDWIRLGDFLYENNPEKTFEATSEQMQWILNTCEKLDIRVQKK